MTRHPRSIVTAVARLVWFDVLRWWPLAAMATLFEAWRATGVEAALHLTPPGAGEVSLFLGGIPTLDAILWLLPVATTMLVIQADHVDDDRAFWRTRPIAPAALAVAKVAFLGLLFVLVPAAIDAVRLAAYGAPLSSMLVSMGQIAARADRDPAGLGRRARHPDAVPVSRRGRRARRRGVLLQPGRPMDRSAAPGVPRPVRAQPGLPGDAGAAVGLAAHQPAWLGGRAGADRDRRRDAHRPLRDPTHGRGGMSGVALVVAPNIWPTADGMSAAPPAIGAAIGGRMTLPAGLSLPARRWIQQERDSVQVSGPPWFCQACLPTCRPTSRGIGCASALGTRPWTRSDTPSGSSARRRPTWYAACGPCHGMAA